MLNFFDDYYCMKFDRSLAFCKAVKVANSIGLVVFLTTVCFDSITIVLSGIAVWVSLVLAVFMVTFFKDLARALFLIALDGLKEKYKLTFECRNNVVYLSTISSTVCNKYSKKKTMIFYCETEYATTYALSCVVRKDKQIANV